MNKIIYGLAQPFNDSYVDYVPLFDQFSVDKTKRSAVELDSLVGMTLNHDYSKEIGRSTSNLTISINDKGIYFKLIPNNKLGLEVYNEVRRKKLSHCSLSYIVEDKQRDYEAEEKLGALSKIVGWDHSFQVYSYSKILVYEMCLTNNPANKTTFCTTNKRDPRLKGVMWGD